MNIKEFKNYIKDLPDDYQFVFSKSMSVKFNPSELSPEEIKLIYPDGNVPEEDELQIVVDTPIQGIAVNEEGKEIRFLLEIHDAIHQTVLAKTS